MVRRATPSLKLVFLRLDDFSNNLMELHVRAKLAVETGNRRRPTNSELKEGQGEQKKGEDGLWCNGSRRILRFDMPAADLPDHGVSEAHY